MKRNILLFLMVQPIGVVLLQAQNTEHYGASSGTQGANSSYFGAKAGEQATANNSNNSFFGFSSGATSKTGVTNSGFGAYTLFSNSGVGNTATGYWGLYSNTSGAWNTANGTLALGENSKGSFNTAVGSHAMRNNVEGNENTAAGVFSLAQNQTGSNNTATGSFALQSNETGNNNTASGNKALNLNKSGYFNTAMGAYALEVNTIGIWNTAVGGQALYKNETGNVNAATGFGALRSNKRGSYNTAHGYQALAKNIDGDFNSALGANAGPSSEYQHNTTALGYQATPTSSNSVRIGNSSVTSIGGQVMWTTFSDGRFKRNIKEDVSGLDFVNQLRPVSYEVDKRAVNKFLNIPDSVTQQLEAKKAPVRETGFVAQEVEAIVKKTGYVFSGIEAPQNEHDHYSIRYAAFVVPLVKAVQELTTQLNDQRLEITALKQKLGISEEGTNGDINTAMNAALFQNNPNPFSVDTEIRMVLPETTRQANMIVYNMEGKELKNIQVTERGHTAVKISGSDLGAGIYLYVLMVDGKVVDTKRLILTK